MKEKVLLNALVIGIFIAGSAVYSHLFDGEPIHLGRLIVVLCLAPVFGYLIWLAYDWAIPEGARRRRGKKRLNAEHGSQDK
ncbi:MAG: hypothetical protein AAF251_00025 [Pseudomonadota bacterium]